MKTIGKVESTFSLQRRLREGNKKRKRLAKVVKMKTKQVKVQPAIARLLEKSTKEQRAKQYSQERMLAVAGSPYWPPITKEFFVGLESGKSFAIQGFRFGVVESLKNGKAVIYTLPKIRNVVFPAHLQYFQVDLNQRIIRALFNWTDIKVSKNRIYLPKPKKPNSL
ncbi:MAG: hypothetical protein WCW44_00770 [archaeon]|jgi:hypothetical protein